MSTKKPPKPANTWTCPHCQTLQASETHCVECHAARFASWAIQVAEHVTEHLADGLVEPLDVLKALQDRPCYRGRELSLGFVAQQIRLLTKDTTALARQIAKARASRIMLDVLETGDSKDKLAVLKGIQVLGEVVEHKGEVITKHVVELHEGPPPARTDGD